MRKQLTGLSFLLMLAGCASAPAPISMNSSTAISGAEESSLLAAADATRDDGRFNEALQIYQQLLVEAPGMPPAQLGLGECLLALGKPQEAKQLFQSLKSNAGLHAAASQGEGLALLALGQPEAAAVPLTDATNANSTLWRSWNALGDVADHRHQPEEALKLYDKALAINPNSAAIINNIGYSRLLSGDTARAVESFHSALALDPRSETIRNNLRLAIAADGKYTDAIVATTRDQLPIVLNNVGYVAMQKGDVSTASAYFARAMEASSSYASVTAKNLELLKAQGTSAP